MAIHAQDIQGLLPPSFNGVNTEPGSSNMLGAAILANLMPTFTSVQGAAGVEGEQNTNTSSSSSGGSTQNPTVGFSLFVTQTEGDTLEINQDLLAQQLKKQSEASFYSNFFGDSSMTAKEMISKIQSYEKATGGQSTDPIMTDALNKLNTLANELVPMEAQFEKDNKNANHSTKSDTTGYMGGTTTTKHEDKAAEAAASGDAVKENDEMNAKIRDKKADFKSQGGEMNTNAQTMIDSIDGTLQSTASQNVNPTL